MKRVLLTGGAGFIGSHLCDRLLREGCRVISMDNFITGNRKNLEHLHKRKDFIFINHDVTMPIKIKGKLDYVMHFASLASPKDYLRYPIKTLEAGSLGTHNSLILAKDKKAKFMLASTSEVYGDPLKHPQPETYWGNVNPVGPRSCYDESKRFAEALTMAYRKSYGIDTKIIRIFNTYGPRMRMNDGRVIPNFIYQAINNKPFTVYGQGRQTRSFCYIDDLIEGIYRFMQTKDGGPINLGNPREFTILSLARLITSLTHTKSKILFKPLPQDDPQQRKPDISKAKELIGWTPKVRLEEGLIKTILWYQQQL